MMPHRANSELLDRLPPHSLEAERGVLAAAMLLPALIDELDLSPGDFYQDAHRRLWEVFRGMSLAGKPVDAVSLLAALRETGQLEAIGGTAYLYEIAQSVPYAANAEYHADIVRRDSQKRAIIRAATAALQDAYEAASEPEQLLGDLEAATASIETGNYRREIFSAHDAALEAILKIDAAAEGRGGGMGTGFYALDQLCGGLFAGELTILAARPSVGKSALAAQIAVHNARKGRLVYFCSLEMEAADIALRSIAAAANVDGSLVRKGRLGPNERAAMLAAANDYAGLALKIDRRPGLGVADVQRQARAMLKNGLALVVIDYLQLLSPADEKANREQQVARMARGLKELARALRLPVLCLAQLNRAIEPHQRPGLANLRESGAIEQDADNVWMIHRPREGIWDRAEGGKRGEMVRRPHPAELLVVKARNGETADIPMDWKPALTSFGCWIPSVEDQPSYCPELSGF